MAARKKTTSKELVRLDLTSSEVGEVLDPEYQLMLDQDAGVLSGGTGWGFISTSNTGFVMGTDDRGQQITESRLDVIVLANTRANSFYEGPYDGQNQAPDCWAILDPTAVDDDGKPLTERDMKPGAENPQHEDCFHCPQNAFGTDDRQRGKACKNYQILAVLPANDLEAGALVGAEGRRIRIPPTSVKKWNSMVKIILQKKVPLPFLVLTLECAPIQGKTYFGVEIVDAQLIQDEEARRVLHSRRKEAIDQLLAPPPKANTEERKQARTRRTPQGRKTRKVQPRKKITRKKI